MQPVAMPPAADAPLILIVEDEPGIRDFVELGLRQEGYRAVAVPSGASGMEIIRNGAPDAIILDIGLPDADGFELVGAIRAQTDAPIVILTARGELDDRVRGLELGADDYIAKPFHFAELLARLRAHLRRRSTDGAALRFADLSLDPHSHTAVRAGRSIALTPRESELLALFLQHAGETLSKEVILDRLWGYAFDGNLVEVYVGYLRRKLGEPALLQTQRGAGYVLREAG